MNPFASFIWMSVATYVFADPAAKLVKRDTAKPIGGLWNEALYAHNVVRQNHVDTPPLVWDESLEADAQNYALLLANTNSFKHAVTKSGENLYVGTGTSQKQFSTAAYLWYEEINRYNYESAWKYNFWGAGSLGHFTQMVWSNTKKVGCAGAVIASGNGYTKTYFVCRYSPAGNVAAQYTTQVKPLKKTSTIPTNPDVLKMKKTCVDLDPGYCSTLQKSMCDASTFAKFNKSTCPATCGVC